MAKGDPLPDGDHVARGCHGGFDENTITASAFARSPHEIEHGLLQISVDWMECVYDDPSNRNIDGSIDRLKRIGVRRPQPVAILPVKEIRDNRRTDGVLNVVEYGSLASDCHSVINGFTGTEADLELQQALADIANKHPLGSIP